ncbi:MAG TPA: hypothetical protein VLE93_01305 [Candidatus Saccharimonadales bacterium]|nr:hypothetical protein [Candidatus Saccharimonadales bacterium]
MDLKNRRLAKHLASRRKGKPTELDVYRAQGKFLQAVKVAQQTRHRPQQLVV